MSEYIVEYVHLCIIIKILRKSLIYVPGLETGCGFKT